ncbi:alpha,alpha-trehalose-phosphate synthase (UDP-forming) [Phreatobacter sp.]|uniref:alpha,alpha-trehalose-phosphate synthase (UDP-forming) n=1 Tax=Phreatobacter sp. TaxID=1966341 RepID=UPI003F7307F8
MSRLVIASNRVALPDGQTAGGLAVALAEALEARGGIWFGWSGRTRKNPPPEARLVRHGKVDYALVDLDPVDQQAHYAGYANSTLWPLCHYRLGLIDARRSDWEAYRRVNRVFARALLPLLRPDDIVWVHDYHLIPLGAELRALGFTGRIGYFHHIPFPVPSVFCALADHRDLMRDFSFYDLVGLQTVEDYAAFIDYVRDEERGTVTADGQVTAFHRTYRVEAFPIAIDAAQMAADAEAAVGTEDWLNLSDSLVGRQLIIGVDRLDYSKGIPNKIDALRILLERYPEHVRAVSFMQIAPLSRNEVSSYRNLRREIEAAAGRLNGTYSAPDWVPLRYLNSSFDRASLAGMHRLARVGLVTPFRDGMNLVAKEFVAAQDPDDPGVLVLSRFAGAARELFGALLVNPYDRDAIADAMHRALTMDIEERRSRWQSMWRAIGDKTALGWTELYIAALTGQTAGAIEVPAAAT